jgi:hypothetical protein
LLLREGPRWLSAFEQIPPGLRYAKRLRARVARIFEKLDPPLTPQNLQIAAECGRIQRKTPA